MDVEGEYSPSEFCYHDDLEKSDVETETGVSESQEVIDEFILEQTEKCKHK